MDVILESFRDIGVELSLDWLAGLELVQESILTDDDVYLALVCSDLRESCFTPSTCPLLPTSMRNRTRFPGGAFLFQVSVCEDISIPDCQRPRTSRSVNRVLKMTLHCGSITLHAIELEPIDALPDAPDAGMKIIIVGSPLFYQGLILLKSDNVRLIGGEVPVLAAAQKLAIDEKIRMRDPLEYRPPLHEIQNRV